MNTTNTDEQYIRLNAEAIVEVNGKKCVLETPVTPEEVARQIVSIIGPLNQQLDVFKNLSKDLWRNTLRHTKETNNLIQSSPEHPKFRSDDQKFS